MVQDSIPQSHRFQYDQSWINLYIGRWLRIFTDSVDGWPLQTELVGGEKELLAGKKFDADEAMAGFVLCCISPNVLPCASMLLDLTASD